MTSYNGMGVLTPYNGMICFAPEGGAVKGPLFFLTESLFYRAIALSVSDCFVAFLPKRLRFLGTKPFGVSAGSFFVFAVL